jgi:hypothetical protein
MTLTKIIQLFSEKGCSRIYTKQLSPNDNSKNQVYLGGSFDVLTILPFKTITPDDSGNHASTRFKAALDFYWLQVNGVSVPAANAQLILYPKYPEIRLSGFLRGCSLAPAELMNSRMSGRILFLGADAAGRLFAYVSGPSSEAAVEFRSKTWTEKVGIFTVISAQPLPSGMSARELIISEMRRIHRLGWIDSKKLSSDGKVAPYAAENGGGFTLEAELGISPNGRPLPDYLGWEVKQLGVPSFGSIIAAKITLMTPEPTGGLYKDDFRRFMDTFGYADKAGIPDRLNFGGVHKYLERKALTGLTLKFRGYDIDSGAIIDSSGAIILSADDNQLAAEWSFSSLIKHWAEKHAFACYVPSLRRKTTTTQYHYAPKILLCSGTGFNRFLTQMVKKNIVYDPGVKMECCSTKPKTKKRSQFRIDYRHIPELYDHSEMIDLEI